ncbi:MAG: hypothetical protein RL557_25 [archaeon]|jgi:hypothetical protein
MVKKEDECNNIEQLKEEYKPLAKKYNLPDFTSLNELFDIEEMTPDTEFFLRKIRRTLMEKISGYLRFVDVMLNPTSTPVFFYKKIKKLESSDKETLSQMYETFGDIETENLLLDLEYSEEKEAHFIKKIFEVFDKQIKKELIKIIHHLMNGRVAAEIKNNKVSYFG